MFIKSRVRQAKTPPPQIIKRPVDIAKIQQRIDDEKYDDMSALQKVTLHVLGCKQTLDLLPLEMFVL